MSEIKNKTGFVILITIIATLGGFLFGFDSGVINGTVDGLKTAFDSNDVATGFNVASMLLGCAAGAFAAGGLADKFGRRTILMVAAVFFTVSAWGSGIAHGSLEFILYRVLGGMGVGAASVLAPAYISEVAPAKYRGMLSSIQQVAIITGLFLAFLSNYLIAKTAGSSLDTFAWGYDAWRWMFWIELAPAVTFFFALFFIPESPRYLVASGQKERAMNVLTKLMGDQAEEKYTEIKATLVEDHKPSFRDIITDIVGPKFWIGLGKLKLPSSVVLTTLRPIVWVGIGLAVFQQLIGINVIFYYGSVLWQAVGFSEDQSLLINVIGGAVSIAGCFVAIGLIDRLGRKALLMIGSIGMFVTLTILTIIFSGGELDANGKLILTKVAGIIALISANIYVFCFNFSWGPVMWVLLGEMFPNQIRGSALAIAGLGQWLANFLITITFPMLLVGIGLAGAYSIYAVCAFISIFFIIKFVKETKGKELEEMEG